MNCGFSATAERHCASASAAPAGLLVDHRQVVPGLVAAQAVIAVGEPVGSRSPQQPQERRLRPRRVAQLAQEQRLEEEQLDIVGIGAAAPPGRRRALRGAD